MGVPTVTSPVTVYGTDPWFIIDRAAGEAESAHAQILEADDRLLESGAPERRASTKCNNCERGCREHRPALHEFPHQSFSFASPDEVPFAGLTLSGPLSFLSPGGDACVDT